jgi:hypothetical protein
VSNIPDPGTTSSSGEASRQGDGESQANLKSIIAKGVIGLVALAMAAGTFVYVENSEVAIEAGGQSVTMKRAGKLDVEFLKSQLEDPKKAFVINALLNEVGYFRLDQEQIDAAAAAQLKARGIMNVREKDVVDRLAEELRTTAGSISGAEGAAVSGTVALAKAIELVPSVRELRERSAQEKEPFQPIASSIEAGVPAERDMPPKFHVYTNDPRYIGRIVTLGSPTIRLRKLVVRAKKGYWPEGLPPLVQLRSDQFAFLGLQATPTEGVRGDTAAVLVNTAASAACLDHPVRKGSDWDLDKNRIQPGDDNCP